MNVTFTEFFDFITTVVEVVECMDDDWAGLKSDYSKLKEVRPRTKQQNSTWNLVKNKRVSLRVILNNKIRETNTRSGSFSKDGDDSAIASASASEASQRTVDQDTAFKKKKPRPPAPTPTPAPPGEATSTADDKDRKKEKKSKRNTLYKSLRKSLRLKSDKRVVL